MSCTGRLQFSTTDLVVEKNGEDVSVEWSPSGGLPVGGTTRASLALGSGDNVTVSIQRDNGAVDTWTY